MTSTWDALGRVGVLLAVLAGCGGSATDEEDLGVVQSELSSTLYTWNKGDAPVDMGVSFGRACFLTKIGGKFEGTGEYVQVVNTTGRWVLSGRSGTSGSITAQARCLYLFPTAYGTWSKGQARVPLQAGGSCFLTRVTGQFNGGGESVGITRDANGQWWLSGGSLAPGGIGASAACIANDAASTTTVNRSGPWVWGILFDGSTSTVPASACFLQGMKGAFEGGGEHIRTQYYPPTAEAPRSSWFLQGSSQVYHANMEIGASGGCIQ